MEYINKIQKDKITTLKQPTKWLMTFNESKGFFGSMAEGKYGKYLNKFIP